MPWTWHVGAWEMGGAGREVRQGSGRREQARKEGGRDRGNEGGMEGGREGGVEG
jgi:hypothetical protein